MEIKGEVRRIRGKKTLILYLCAIINEKYDTNIQ